MHPANLSKSSCTGAWLGAEPELAAPLLAFVILTVLLDVVVTRVATDGDFEPPHPASAIAAAAATSASPPDRGYVVLLSRRCALFKRSAWLSSALSPRAGVALKQC